MKDPCGNPCRTLRSNLPLFRALIALSLSIAPLYAQHPGYGQRWICENGVCRLVNVELDKPLQSAITISPLTEAVDLTAASTRELGSAEDRLDAIIRATCRVTVSGTCGSGTIVGKHSDGSAIVLTNAHVAGTQKGRQVNVERWNQNGSGERGQGTVIAAGYGRGMSVDFALLKCNAGFATGVTPIPLADRYPDPQSAVTTYGCPRCEWPSLQVLALNRRESQVLTWKPEAIGGRSGSSLIDYTEAGPRVVGLLTWGGGGEGLGQSTPFLLQAMRGRLPKALESLPPGVREVPCFVDDDQPTPAPTVLGLSILEQAAPFDDETKVSSAEDDVIDAITEKPPRPDQPTGPGSSGILTSSLKWFACGALLAAVIWLARRLGTRS